ncbi:uncharacterized protein [Venturia canescens]|uniref:uncharacterized protein n=1 Tax=Venturia canescens TaxID=32260 RepID=UPI001C9CDD3C|nr:uncharacterized protein LOC122417562 [Venturia canescens]
MRFFGAIAVLLLWGVIEQVAGRKYFTIVFMTNQTKVYPDNGLLVTKTPVEDVQNLTYLEDVDSDTYFFWGKISWQQDDGKTTPVKVLNHSDGQDICEERKNGSWEALAGRIIRRTWLPLSVCPVHAGHYKLRTKTVFGAHLNEKLAARPPILYLLDVEVASSDRRRKIFDATYLIQIG